MPDQIIDRITDIVEVKLGDVLPGKNWKTHPPEQIRALKDIVEQFGWAGVPLAYYSERNGGKLTYLDGHARRGEFPDAEVRVAVTDYTDSEVDQLILVYDPVAAMAEADADILRELTEGFFSESEALLELVEGLAGKDTPVLHEFREEIRPKKMLHILVSVPVDRSLDVQAIMSRFDSIDGAEILYGSN